MSAERLQKVLASAGIASRRDCEELIGAGRVSVNGKVVIVPGTRVDPEQDEIAVDGQSIGKINPRTYIMLHKPTGVVSTADDPQGRPTVVAMVDLPVRLFPVGRLDYDSEGLLLMTDDGELTQRLTHPSYQIEKEYRALLDQAPSGDALREWRAGVVLDDAPTAPAWVDVLERGDEGVWVRVVLHEGRKRQIREVAKALGYEVLRLIRVREGPVLLGNLPSGEWRKLTEEEVEALWSHVGGRDAEIPDTERAAAEASGTGRGRRRVVAASTGERPSRRTARTETGDSASGAPPRPTRSPQAADENQAQRSNERDDIDRPPRSDDRPKRDERANFNARGPRRDDRSGFDNRGPRRDDRGEFDNRGPRPDNRGSFDNRGPRRDDRGGFDNRGPRPDNRGSFDNRGPRRDERGGFDNRGPRRDDRGGFDNRGPRRDDRGGFDNRGPRRDDRGGFDNRGPRRDDRGSFDNRGPRRDDRGGFDNRGPRPDNRGSFDNRGPRRDDRGGFDNRGPRPDNRGSFDNRGARRDDRGGFDNRGPRRDDRGGFDNRGSRPDSRRGFDARGPRRDDRDGFDNRRPQREASANRPDYNDTTALPEQPDRGNERPPARDMREEKRSPGREWQERTSQERRNAQQRIAPRGGRGFRFGERSGAKRTGFPFRPRPPREKRDEE